MHILNCRRDRQSVRPTLLLTLVIALSGACGENPVAPSEDEFVTETLTGVVTQLGLSTQVFNVALQGRVDATVLSLEPLSTITLGAQLGTWNGTTCSILIEREIRQGETLSRSLMPVGDNCISIVDVGNVSEAVPITYVLEVVHS